MTNSAMSDLPKVGDIVEIGELRYRVCYVNEGKRRVSLDLLGPAKVRPTLVPTRAAREMGKRAARRDSLERDRVRE